MLKYQEAQWAPSIIPGMSVLPRKMEGFKWVRIQGHIPSDWSIPRGQGRGFLSKGKFYILVAEGRKRISSEALQWMKSSTWGNTNSLKSRGKVFPWALGFLTQMKTWLCWAKSWAKPYKNAKIHRTVANCSVPLSLPGCPDSLQAQHWIFLLLSQALCYSPSSLKPCAPGLCYSYLFLNEFPAHRLQSEISKCKWLKAQTTEGK